LHQVLLDAAHNPYLLSAVEVLDIHFRRIEMVYFADLAPAEGSAEEHDGIIAAAEAGAASRVGRLVRANIMRGLGRRPRPRRRRARRRHGGRRRLRRVAGSSPRT
jgi:DNA-binding GntR family transcriptional regulator